MWPDNQLDDDSDPTTGVIGLLQCVDTYSTAAGTYKKGMWVDPHDIAGFNRKNILLLQEFACGAVYQALMTFAELKQYPLEPKIGAPKGKGIVTRYVPWDKWVPYGSPDQPVS